MKGVMRFGKKGKLSPRYIGPYRIAKRIGNVAYELELPQELAAAHPVFHISKLKKCIGDPSLILPTESIKIKDNLSYEEVPVQILDRQVRRLRTKDVASVKSFLENNERNLVIVIFGNAEFVAKCPNCQQVKVEHQRPGGLAQRIELPEWKWEMINMDFITGLPRSRRQHDSIWVIVDRMTKLAHFLPVKTTNSAEDYAKLYIQEVVRLHGVPVSIISDRGAPFTTQFWKSFQKGLGSKVNLSTVFHHQTDGQAERTIQTLEDMLRACVIDFKGNWDDHLPLIEFAYNNSYHSSIQMAPYEALYGRRCRSPIGWFEVGEAQLIGLDLVHQAMEKVKVIQERLKTAQSRQKSYTDVRRRALEFEVDDWVYLKVSPMKGVMRFGKKGKLSPRYIGPYRIAKRIGNVAYELELPQELAAAHPVFHISKLKKCIGDPSLILPTESIKIKDNLSYEEVPVQILDRQVRRLRTKDVASVKVLWRNQFVEEATWEAEEDMKKRYPHLLESGGNAD
ncbi:hypothetical protein MTR67_001349 [Solanum verrucosum]|uniref:Integrase catalytic domain-containing protein n=1 Tax=Solanum verrucosum TaxID=315347 RepID=A0AAF0PN16_SOLVR|nr:hypothetical protein MTR67_001349 [Solanum verrucosum]